MTKVLEMSSCAYVKNLFEYWGSTLSAVGMCAHFSGTTLPVLCIVPSIRAYLKSLMSLLRDVA